MYPPHPARKSTCYQSGNRFQCLVYRIKRYLNSCDALSQIVTLIWRDNILDMIAKYEIELHLKIRLGFDYTKKENAPLLKFI